MKEKSESLSAADFFEKLQHDKLDDLQTFSITGMVKKSEGKDKKIEFAPGGNCSHWVTIPLDLIEDVEMIKTIPCKDHSHPLVKLNMKNPKTPEGKIFLALLEGMKQRNEGHQPQPGMQAPWPTHPKSSPSMRRSPGFGASQFGGSRLGGIGIGGGLGYGCSEYGCTCTGVFDCIQMCEETDTCWWGKCVEQNGRLYCPWY